MSLRELAELTPCRRCGAAPTFPCITDGSRGGRRRSTYPHAVRQAPILAAWREGFGEGLEQAFEDVERRLTRELGPDGGYADGINAALSAVAAGRSSWLPGA